MNHFNLFKSKQNQSNNFCLQVLSLIIIAHDTYLKKELKDFKNKMKNKSI